MWTPARLNDGKTTNYGLGWSVQTVHGHRMVGHGGASVTGFQTNFSHFPEDKLSVVVFSNCLLAGVDRVALHPESHARTGPARLQTH